MKERRIDGLLFAATVTIALLLRLIYLWQLRGSPYFSADIMDASIHDAWARKIAAGEPWTDGAYFRAPLYPWFLGLLYSALGGAAPLVRVVQCALGSLSCGLVFLVGRQAFGRGVGLVAGLACAAYWTLIFFDAELLIPVLAVPLNLLALLFLMRAGRSAESAGAAAASPPTLTQLALAGVPLGLSALARPNVLLFAPAAFFWLLAVAPRAARWRTVALYTAAVLLPVLPVTAINAARSGDFVLISSQGGVNLHIGNNPQADGMHVYIPGLTLTTDDIYEGSARLAEREAGRPLSASEVSAHYGAKVRNWVADSPGAALSLLARKAGYFWTWREILNNKDLYLLSRRYTPLLTWLPVGFWIVGPFGLVGIAACLLGGRERLRATFPLFGFVACYMVSVVLFFVNARFRVPVLPVLAVLAAYGAFELVRLSRARATGKVAALVAVLVVGGLLVARRPPLEASPAIELERIAAALTLQGKFAEALAAIDDAIAVDPDAEALMRTKAAIVQEARRRGARVDAAATDAVRQALSAGDLDGAIRSLGAAEGPVEAEMWDAVTGALIRLHRYREALELLPRWIAQQPDSVEALSRTAVLRGAAPDSALRDCRAARAAGERAVNASGGTNSEATIALATALAECGEFERAVARADEAMRLARQAGDDRRARQYQAQYDLFRAGRKLRLREPVGR